MAVMNSYKSRSESFDGGRVYWNGKVYDGERRFLSITYFVRTERGQNEHEFTAVVTKSGEILDGGKYPDKVSAALSALGWGKK